LGFRIYPGTVRLCNDTWARFRRKVREREAAYRAGEIDEEELARSVQSMLGHIQRADMRASRRAFFTESLDLG
ncbi:MAG: RNA-dependent DNA polymerase, partial [Blastocatellia bacterium]|nr:RNA-dependent DNA polymerase [Blastocatellia bacterium]